MGFCTLFPNGSSLSSLRALPQRKCRVLYFKAVGIKLTLRDVAVLIDPGPNLGRCRAGARADPPKVWGNLVL